MESKIIERIRRLLALSKSSNAHEAAQAAGLAAQMMIKYELEMADVEASEEKKPDEGVCAEVIGDRPYRHIETWKSMLAKGVADGFGCHIWWERTQCASMPSFVVLRAMGRKSNIATFTYMFKYLETEIDRISKETRAHLPVHIRPLGADAIRWYNSFKLGAASTIAKRLKQERADVMEGKGEANTTALAIVRKGQDDVDAAFAAYKRKSGMKTEAASAPNIDDRAVAMGAEAASRINLGGNKGLSPPAQQIKSA